MANCADCGENPKRGCLKDCPRDKTRSIWARYRARKKAREAADEQEKAEAACVAAIGEIARFGGKPDQIWINGERVK